MRAASLIFLTVISLTCALAAEPLSVNAGLSTTQIYQGESATFEIQIKGLQDGQDTRPDTSKLEADFDVTDMEHGWTGRSQQITIINGRRTERVEHGMLVYRYRLTPKKTGQLTVPPATVNLNGTNYSTPQLTLNVAAPEQQDVAILEILTEPKRVFPMKSFTVTLKILLKPIPGDPQDPVTVTDAPVLNLAWKDQPEGLKGDEFNQVLQRAVSRTGRGFSISGVSSNDPFAMFEQRLAVFNFYTGRELRKGADGKELSYYVYQVKRTFVPQRPGMFKFGATVKGMFADGFEGNGKRLRGRSLLAVAPEQAVVCEDFPEPKPANFSGAIGSFKLQAATQSHDLRVGDPLTLKLDFVRQKTDGAGPLEDIAALNIASNAQIAADFSIVEQATSGQVKGSAKSFSYVLRPKKAGVSIPAVSASVFNPDSGKYEEIASPPIALNVTDTPQLRPDELVSATPLSSSQKISGRDKGVFQNISDLSELNKSALRPFNYLLLAAGLWAAFAIGSIVLRVQRQRAGDTVWQNKQRSTNEAAAHLSAARAALNERKSETASLEVQRALQSLIARRCGLEPAGMTASDAARSLEKLGVGAPARAETARILEEIEAAKYSSGSSSQAEAQVAAVEKLIPVLQREMDSGAV